MVLCIPPKNWVGWMDVLFKWSTQHWHSIVSASSHQVYVVLEVAQAMPLWDFHHRFRNLFTTEMESNQTDATQKRTKKCFVKMMMKGKILIKYNPLNVFQLNKLLTVCGCETGTANVFASMLKATIIKIATAVQTFIFLLSSAFLPLLRSRISFDELLRTVHLAS